MLLSYCSYNTLPPIPLTLMSLCVYGSLELPPSMSFPSATSHIFSLPGHFCISCFHLPQTQSGAPYLKTCSAFRARCLCTVVSMNSFSFLLQLGGGQPPCISVCVSAKWDRSVDRYDESKADLGVGLPALSLST